jgi:hypothetical protein
LVMPSKAPSFASFSVLISPFCENRFSPWSCLR